MLSYFPTAPFACLITDKLWRCTSSLQKALLFETHPLPQALAHKYGQIWTNTDKYGQIRGGDPSSSLPQVVIFDGCHILQVLADKQCAAIQSMHLCAVLDTMRMFVISCRCGGQIRCGDTPLLFN